MSPGPETKNPDTAGPRRRRRGSASAPAAPPAGKGRRRIGPGFLSSWGLSTTFRVYIFLGGIAVVMAVLLYNEKMIRDVKEQERNQVHLYAKLIQFAVSHMASDEQAAFIFQEVIHNPTVEFPLIFTDHRGRIINYRGAGLPAKSDTSAAARRTLEAAKAEMDAINEPIPVALYPEASGYVHLGEGGYAVSDAEGYPVAWDGPGLPAADDTSATARAAAEAFAAGLSASRFTVPAEGLSSLYFADGALVVTDPDGRPVFWGGGGLPAADDSSAAALAAVGLGLERLGALAPPRPLSIPTQQYIHFGDSALVSRVSVAVFVQIGAIILFALIGYVGFRNIRRSEQRSIWVGMAKETAHQLGTPLSPIIEII